MGGDMYSNMGNFAQNHSTNPFEEIDKTLRLQVGQMQYTLSNLESVLEELATEHPSRNTISALKEASFAHGKTATTETLLKEEDIKRSSAVTAAIGASAQISAGTIFSDLSVTEKQALDSKIQNSILLEGNQLSDVLEELSTLRDDLVQLRDTKIKEAETTKLGARSY